MSRTSLNKADEILELIDSYVNLDTLEYKDVKVIIAEIIESE